MSGKTKKVHSKNEMQATFMEPQIIPLQIYFPFLTFVFPICLVWLIVDDFVLIVTFITLELMYQKMWTSPIIYIKLKDREKYINK